MTAVSEKLTEECEEKLIHFQKFVSLLRNKHSYLLSQIENSGLTPIRFDMSESTAVECVGGKPVQVRMIGLNKQQCTVMLEVIIFHHL
jgi:hypothetical protein